MDTNEEKELKLSDFEEDFADSDGGAISDEMYKELETEQKVEFGEDVPEEDNVEEIKEEPQQEQQEQASQEETKEEIQEEISPWEKLSQDNSVVKKYIFYITKDLAPYIDNMTIDERNVFVNDAIQKKIDDRDEEKQKTTKKKLLIHSVIMILTICICTPFVLLGAHKAIMATFDNYKYSQENFEKLYKQRFQKDRAYMRSVQYIQEQQKKLKQSK